MTAENPDDKENQDAAHNPGEKHFEDLVSGKNSPADDLNQRERQSNPGSDSSRSADSSTSSDNPNKNIDSVAEQERDGGSMNYTGKGENAQGKSKGRWWGVKNIKKKGPLAFLLFAMAGGGGILSILFSPGIALVQLKEILVGDLNDQANAMDIRSDHMFRAKLDSIQGNASICTSKVTIRCKFATMSKKQVQKFKDAGFIIEPSEPDKRFGRTKPTQITFPETDDGKPRVTVSNPAEMRAHLKGNFVAMGQLRHAFNPLSAGFWDRTAGSVFARFKTDKSKKVVGGNAEERDKSITEAASGEKAGMTAKGTYTDEDGREYVTDEDGRKVYAEGEGSNPEKFEEIADKNKSVLADIASKAEGSSPGATAVDSATRGLNIAGSLDTACTVYNTARAAAAAAKIARALQLVQYAMVFFVTADRIKAQVATPEEVEHLGNKLTAVDTEETVVDEESTWEEEGGELVAAEHENPYYMMNAFDSPGYKTAAYNEAPTLTSSDLQFAIGGGLAGGLSRVMDEVAVILGGRENIRGTCSTVQSWWARTAGLIAGVVSAVGTFGFSTYVSIGASVAIGFAMPYLTAAIADIIAGTVTSGATESVDAGNALFGGTGALMGGMAMARGMKPAKSSEIKSYMAATEQVQNDRIALETFEAQKTPFDITNQYSFLGSAIRKINPALIKTTASFSGALSGLPSIITTGFSSLIPQANAAQVFNPERFKKCTNDEGYRELGIDADVFCNVRYIMSDKQLGMNPLETAAWMEANGHINEDGSSKSTEYQDWLKNCTEREDGWGETSNDDNVSDGDIGKTCMVVNDTHDNFVVFTMDKSIDEGMDDQFGSENSDSAFFDPHLDNSIATTKKDSYDKN